MELEPITRQEKIIAGQDLTPITRMEKFLKNFGGGGGGGVQPDWNQNDDTQPDYVKNRPFWREKTKELMFPHITGPIEVTTENDGNGFFIATGELFSLKPDVTNYVVFDGVEYTCEPYYSEEEGAMCIGSFDFRDYPFFISYGVISTKTAGNHTVLQYYDAYTVQTNYAPCLVINTRRTEDGKPYLEMADVEKIKAAFKKSVPITLYTSYLSEGFTMRVNDVTTSFIYASGFGNTTYVDIMKQAEFVFNVRDGSLKYYRFSYSGSIKDNMGTYPLMYINNKRYKITVDDSGKLTATEVT